MKFINWSFILREEPRMRMFENRVLGVIIVLIGTEVTGSGENYIMRSLMICTDHQMICTAHQMICTAHQMICTDHQMICTDHQILFG
jgi:hypothetical protein